MVSQRTGAFGWNFLRQLVAINRGLTDDKVFIYHRLGCLLVHQLPTIALLFPNLQVAVSFHGRMVFQLTGSTTPL